MDLSNRKKGGYSGRIITDSTQRRNQSPKSGVHFTSEMQGILAIKESNESKAADIVTEYLISLAERTYDEKIIMQNLNNMLNGFTEEEKLRIVSAALVRTLCRVS